MDTVNFLGISIVGQSNKGGDGGIYVGSIMKGLVYKYVLACVRACMHMCKYSPSITCISKHTYFYQVLHGNSCCFIPLTF